MKNKLTGFGITRYNEVNPRRCNVPGCNALGQHMGQYHKDGTPRRRSTCSKHHSMAYGMGGWDYKQYRKDYCENIDGRLGFVCTTTIIDYCWQLDADHINGDPDSHKTLGAAAIQTLCKCCHAIKTRDNGDCHTIGRSRLKTKHDKQKNA